MCRRSATSTGTFPTRRGAHSRRSARPGMRSRGGSGRGARNSTAADERLAPVTRERWTTLLVVSAATAMLLLDVTVVNVALPAIREDLDASFGEMQWVIDAYALTLAATLLSAGALADRIGRRGSFGARRAVVSARAALRAPGVAP